MASSIGDGSSTHSVGDRVVLKRAVGPVACGSQGKVLGFLRRDIDLLVVSFDGAAILQLRPEDLAGLSGLAAT